MAGAVAVLISFFLLEDHSVCCADGGFNTLFFGVGWAAGRNTLMEGVNFSSSLRFCGGVEFVLLVPLESSLLLISSSCFFILSRTSEGTGWVV